MRAGKQEEQNGRPKCTRTRRTLKRVRLDLDLQLPYGMIVYFYSKRVRIIEKCNYSAGEYSDLKIGVIKYMGEQKTGKILWALIPIIIALISIFALSKLATSPASFSGCAASLQDKRDDVLELTATSTALSAALSALPGDTATPIAEKLVDLSGYFLIILSALVLEKYLLIVSGYATFYVLIPIACICASAAILTSDSARKEVCTKIGIKMLAFGLAIFLVVPMSLKVSDIIEEAYPKNVESTIEDATNTADTINDSVQDEDKGLLGKVWEKLSKAAVGTVTELTNKAESALNNFIDVLSIMIVTSCLIPIVVLIFLVWLCKIILGININVPKLKGRKSE